MDDEILEHEIKHEKEFGAGDDEFYWFRVDNVRNFIEFCENSGGFIIT